MGRKRERLASMTASQFLALLAFGLDLFDEYYGISSNHADQRQDAENGHKTERLTEMSSAATTPIRPIGTTLSTRKRRLKLCNWAIRNVSIRKNMTVQRRKQKPEIARFLRPCLPRRCDRVSGDLHSILRPPEREQRPRLRVTAGSDFRLHGQRRDAVAAPDQRIFLLEIEGRDLAERNGPSIRERDLHGAQRRERNALFVVRPRNDVDQIDAIPDLRDGLARNHGIQHIRRVPECSGPAAAPGPGRRGCAPSAPARSNRN